VDGEIDVTLLEAAAPVAPAAPAVAAAPQTIKPKHIAKQKTDELKRKMAEEEEELKKRAAEQVPLADKFAEAARQKALQERADLELAADSLGFKSGGAGTAAAPGVPVTGDNVALVNALTLDSPEAFKLVGAKVAAKVNESAGKSLTNALNFYREVLRSSSDKLTASELKDLQVTLGIVLQKKEEEARKAKGPVAAKKKKGTKVNMTAAYDEEGEDYDGDYGAVGAPAPARGAASTDNAAFIGDVGGDLGAATAGAASAGGEDAVAAYKAATANIDGDFM